MIKFRWSRYHKRLVAYATGMCTLLETAGPDGMWSAEYKIRELTDDPRNPYRYHPYNG
jgi:hypothetical protein